MKVLNTSHFSIREIHNICSRGSQICPPTARKTTQVFRCQVVALFRPGLPIECRSKKHSIWSMAETLPRSPPHQDSRVLILSQKWSQMTIASAVNGLRRNSSRGSNRLLIARMAIKRFLCPCKRPRTEILRGNVRAYKNCRKSKHLNRWKKWRPTHMHPQLAATTTAINCGESSKASSTSWKPDKSASLSMTMKDSCSQRC